MEVLLIFGAFALSVGNGANDNFKGFATVWGSETLSYRRALTLANLATFAGALASVFLAEALVHSFSGRGLVSASIISAPSFVASLAVGAGLTILLATRLGFPVSTTHALIGALVGAGLGQGGDVVFSKLLGTFFAPLLLSPLVAAVLAVLVYRLTRRGLTPANDCVCLVPAPLDPGPGQTASLTTSAVLPRVVLDSTANCESAAAPLRVSVSRWLDRLHVASAAAICFARGVNDTPKLAALLIAGQMLGVQSAALAVAAAMVLGGWFFSARVAQTMSHRMTRLDHGQGIAANLVAALLILFASKLGMPVSTTHVTVGAIAGVGVSAETLDPRVLRNVLLSWLVTLPVAMIGAFGVSSILGE